MAAPQSQTPDLDRIVSLYRSAYAASGPSSGALLDPKGRQAHRFAALTAPIRADGFTLLDYGCGLADLKATLDRRFTDYAYAGVDIVDDFVAASSARYPEARFSCIARPEDVEGEYDFIVISGAFNLLVSTDVAVHKAYLDHALTTLFAKTRIALCVDFMRADVDFVQDGAYHQDPSELAAFISTLTRRFVLDQSYLPYEFALIAYKDDAVLRPMNTFAAGDGKDA